MTTHPPAPSPPDLLPIIMEKVQSLSPEQQQYVLDYVEFLVHKYCPSASPQATLNN